MSDKVLSKVDFQKRAKIDNEKFQFFIERKILKKKDKYTEADLDSIREFRKSHPMDQNDIIKRFKVSREQITGFISHGLISESPFISSNDMDIFHSWQKLKRLGYNDAACFKVLSEVGVPKDENLFEDKNLIQLKNLSERTGIPERTIKFYEKENLILKPRIYKNKRFYDIKIVEDLLLIRDLQQIGYKLSSISEFLEQIRKNTEKENAVSKIKIELNDKIKITKAIIQKVEAL